MRQCIWMHLCRYLVLATPFIYLSIVFDALLLSRTFPKARQGQKTLHLFTCSKLPLISANFSYIYSCTLSFHLAIGLPLLLESSISLTFSSQTLHSSFPKDDQITSKYIFSLIPHHSICTSSHATSFIHFIALIFPSCHSTCSS